MRTLSEISKDFTEIQTKENELRERRKELCKELAIVWKSIFEKNHGVEKGDLIEDIFGRRFFYNTVDIKLLSPWVVCNKVKKDGTPSLARTDVYIKNFADGDIKVLKKESKD